MMRLAINIKRFIECFLVILLVVSQSPILFL
ncbi:Uncharacterised protein [Vibrio cholerae]|nr:Uncharacterised protein [Vibrio cholerae]CSI78198.1 Uncharacterised protein [Vibrio cholerae]